MIDKLGYYLQESGQIVKIKEINGEDVHQDNCYTLQYDSYFPDGRYDRETVSDKDLIAHIPDALQYEILRIIEAYHTTDSFKSIIDNCYKNHLEKKEI